MTWFIFTELWGQEDKASRTKRSESVFMLPRLQ